MTSQVVTVPMPEGEAETLFERQVDAVVFARYDLELFLTGIKQELDAVSEQLETDREYKLVSYNLELTAAGFPIGEPLLGGFCYASERSWGFSVRKLRDRYESSFNRILEEYEGQPLSGDLSVVAFRDTSRISVPALDPSSNTLGSG